MAWLRLVRWHGGGTEWRRDIDWRLFSSFTELAGCQWHRCGIGDGVGLGQVGGLLPFGFVRLPLSCSFLRKALEAETTGCQKGGRFIPLSSSMLLAVN